MNAPDYTTSDVLPDETRDGVNGTGGPKGLAALRRSFRRLRHGFLPSIYYKRLEDSLPASHRELAALVSRQKDDAARLLLEEAGRMLRHAQEALEQEGNPGRGWHLFKASSRLQLYAMTDEELLARARSILSEATDDEKGLSSWRRAAIRKLLADEQGRLDESIRYSAGKVVHAAKILDEHHDNVYHKLTIARERYKALTLLSALAVAFWITVLPRTAMPATAAAGAPEDPRTFWATVVVAGIVGAIISGFTSSIAKSGGRTRIPLELGDSSVTFARLGLGALSAIAVTTLLGAGILRLGDIRYEMMLAAAMVAGFSERLLLRAFESVSK